MRHPAPLRRLALGNQRGNGDQAAVAGAEIALSPQVAEQHVIGVPGQLRCYPTHPSIDGGTAFRFTLRIEYQGRARGR